MLAQPPTGDEVQGGAAGTTNRDGRSATVPPLEATRASPPSSRLNKTLLWVIRRPRLAVGILFLGAIVAGVVAVSPHVRAWYHLREARSALQHWHNAQAIRHLKRCLSVWPRDPDVLILAARSARRTRAYAEAERLLEMYQQARGLDEAYTTEELLLSAERGVDKVVELCWRYVEQGHADTSLMLEALTRGYLRQYRLAEARMCLNRWKELEPENAQLYCLEGLLFLDYAHSQAAGIESFRRAVELDAEHEEARQGLAVALLSNNNAGEAVPHLEYLRQRQPDNLSVQVGLAEAFERLGRVEEAKRLLDGVLQQQPEHAPALALRGRIAMTEGQSQEAERLLREAVRVNPVEHRARFSLIQCLNQNGKAEESQQLRQKFEQLEEDLTRFNEVVTRELVQRPRDPALHCTIGQLLLRTGQNDEGLRWLQSALRLDPQYAPARQALDELKQKAKAQAKQAEPAQPAR